jgi:beta-N-acetylhexosaminidase
MDEMVAVAAAVPALSERGAERLATAMASVVEQPKGMDFAQAIANRDALLAQA